MNEKDGLKSIFELSKYKFVIESYQRGYRWEEKQVINLLEDLLEFRRGYTNLYCLQPIIVKRINENEYELIDGQQRLTTIYILLKYLHQNEYLYEIEYKRPKSKEFLENIENIKDEDINNLDFYFMKRAYETIEKWFVETNEREQIGNLKQKFATLLLENEENEKKVKFIWYEVNNTSETSEEIFTRINVGKIPLNDAELIKAKLLFDIKSEGKEKYLKQLEIGNEWDKIENSLQDNSFWRFLVNYKKEKTNRIEYIFDLVSGKSKDDEEYYTFETISKLIEEYAQTENEYEENEKDFWNKNVKRYYSIFKDWYKDVELYNYIGFLNFFAIKNTNELLKEYENFQEKDEFKKKVKEIIIENVKSDVENLEELDYEKDKYTLKKILILFNIITMNKQQEKFPYEKYKLEEWSLEHIHPRNIRDMGNDKEKWKTLCDNEITTIKNFITFFEERQEKEKTEKYRKILEKIQNLRSNIQLIKDNKIRAEYEDIKDLMKDEYGSEYVHNIANLTLLDKDTNSKISNNYFDTKRREIINMEIEGGYIPVCTKNVFLKFYSSNPNNVYFWTDDDRKDYKDKIEKTLQEFIDI